MSMTYYEELLANTNMSQQEVQEYLLLRAFDQCDEWQRRFTYALMNCHYLGGRP
mgnify:CR=1 FL=1